MKREGERGVLGQLAHKGKRETSWELLFETAIKRL